MSVDREHALLLGRGLGVVVILSLSLGIAVPAGREYMKVREARGDIRVLGGIGLLNWRMDFGPGCPPSAEAVARHIGSPRTHDPWGEPYQIRCPPEPSVPREAPSDPKGWPRILSAGPDRILGTCDDVTRPAD